MSAIIYLVKVVVVIISVIAWNEGQRHKKPSPRYWMDEIRIDTIRIDSASFVTNNP